MGVAERAAELSRVPLRAERPPIELPKAQRHANYGLQGSCAYAAAEDLLSLHGRDDLARYVRAHYAGGAVPSPGCGFPSLVEVAEALDLDYDYVRAGRDARKAERWLAAAGDRRLGAVVHFAELDGRGRLDYGSHAVTFLGFDRADQAWYLNNNDTSCYRHRPRAEFLAIWLRSGGDAFTFVFPSEE